MTVAITPMTDSDAKSWDDFVRSTAGGTFFHLSSWAKIFPAIFGHSIHYLMARRGGELVGILPLVHQKSRLFGNALMAAPFLVEGGPLVRDDEAKAALDQAAIALKHKVGAQYIEFRSRTASRPHWQARKGLYATFKRPLSANDEDNLLAIPRKQRAVVRKTLTGELTSIVDPEVDSFFRVYSESVRNLGTPVFAKRYFAMLLKVFPNDSDIVVVREGAVPMSAVLNFYHGDTVLPYYGGGTRLARQKPANDFMYWEVMRQAVARGYRRFDFGRSKAGTGAFSFKKNWGFAPEWLEYEYHFAPGHSMPDKNPLNPKYALMIQAWKKLPLPVANLLGPLLIRGLG